MVNSRYQDALELREKTQAMNYVCMGNYEDSVDYGSSYTLNVQN